jgi:hypothetical protein
MNAMKSDMNKERWVNEAMASLEGIARAQPGNDLLERIAAGIQAPKTVRIISLHPQQWAAAAILLLSLNIGSAVYFAGHNNKTASANSNPLAIEIQSGSTYNY